eukprot:5320229-Pyramimonas_sp.AAC.2
MTAFRREGSADVRGVDLHRCMEHSSGRRAGLPKQSGWICMRGTCAGTRAPCAPQTCEGRCESCSTLSACTWAPAATHFFSGGQPMMATT